CLALIARSSVSPLPPSSFHLSVSFFLPPRLLSLSRLSVPRSCTPSCAPLPLPLRHPQVCAVKFVAPEDLLLTASADK
ncbi:unnamed protein product, partial [Closterium sp. NIES-53]